MVTRDSDREMVLAAVQRGGRALRYASAELRADREVVLAAVQQYADALEYASAELQADDDLRRTCGLMPWDDAELHQHMFADLDRLSDDGQLKVLRTLASVRECGRQMNNCLADYNLDDCSRHIIVKLDGDDGAPLAVGSFVRGEWDQIRYAHNQDARGGGNRACARGSAAALPPAHKVDDILGQFDAFLPALQVFAGK